MPNTVYDEVIDYLDKINTGKACRSGSSLLDSENFSNLMTHNNGSNIRYTFICGYCFPVGRQQNKIDNMLSQLLPSMGYIPEKIQTWDKRMVEYMKI